MAATSVIPGQCLGWGLGFYTKVLLKTLPLKLSVSNLAFNYFAGTILIIKDKNSSSGQHAAKPNPFVEHPLKRLFQKVLKVELGAAIFI